MLDALFKVATGTVMLVAFAVFALSTLALDRLNPKNLIRQDLKEHYVATDSTFLYDTGKVTAMLALYEPEHYEAHERFILRYDLVYPLCYGIPSLLLLVYLYPWGGAGPRWLVVLPLATMAFDYAENFTMLAFLRRFRADPQTPLALLKVSRAFTVAKLSVILISFALLLLFIGWRLFARMRAAAS